MVYSSSGFQERAYTEDGMYYFDYNTLKFYDKTTGKDVAVCSKPDCEHKGESCYAHFDAEPYFGSVMVYDDKIYVNALNDETIELEDGSTFETGIVKLYQMDMDGSNRKEICSIDGAILSKLAVDGKLYYTAYIRTIHEENTYMHDCVLYCYDINWGTNKELCSFKGSDTRYSASLRLLPSPDSPSCLYMLYEYQDRKCDEYIDGLSDQEFQDLDMEELASTYYTEKLIRYQDGKITESDFPVNIRIHCITEEGAYCTTNYYSDNRIRSLVLMNENGESEKVAEYSEDARIDAYEGYFHFVYTDEEKMLYDYKNDIWYIANTAIRDEEKWIPNIYYIDAESDTIYYDAHDYTGLHPGQLISADLSMNASGSWKEFLEANYTEYDGRKLDWISVAE